LTGWPQQVLDFWFGLAPEQWWKADSKLDREVAERFGKLWEEQRQFPADTFLASPQEALAAVILFDQFPRNMFRGHADSFATDHLALGLAKAAIETGAVAVEPGAARDAFGELVLEIRDREVQPLEKRVHEGAEPCTAGDVREREPLLAVQPDQLAVHADRRGAGGESEHHGTAAGLPLPDQLRDALRDEARDVVVVAQDHGADALETGAGGDERRPAIPVGTAGLRHAADVRVDARDGVGHCWWCRITPRTSCRTRSRPSRSGS